MRVEPGLALGQRDLVRPDRVSGAGGRQRVRDQVQHPPRHVHRRASATRFVARSGFPAARFMIVARNRCYLPRTGHDHGSALWGGGQKGSLGGEGGAEAAGAPAGGAVQGVEGVGEAAFAPGQAGGQHRWRRVESAQGGRRRGGLVRGQGEGGLAPGRGGQRHQRRVPLPRAPEHRRPPVGPGQPEPAAQRGGQHSPGQQQRPDRVGGRVPPADRGGERERARRRVHAGTWSRRRMVAGPGERKGCGARTNHARTRSAAELHEGRAGDPRPGGARP